MRKRLYLITGLFVTLLPLAGLAFQNWQKPAPAESPAAQAAGSANEVFPDPEIMAPPYEIPEKILRLWEELLGEEPSAVEVQSEVIRYNQLESTPFKKWHRLSRLRAIMPDFSFGADEAKGNSVDLDRGGTSDPDLYILGPDSYDRGWDLDVSWDLGDLLWSSSQTSIDSRHKITVDLRYEMIREATRIYFDRRRLQTRIVSQPALNEQQHLARLVGMDELTAMLDGMTGGWFGKNLAEIYAIRPDFEALWTFMQE